ncbi:MAG: ABC transporter substrate-binding protein [Desulfobulbaceae bacterium]|jgi:branched-chain amino acid transport system substrate-binding protein|nr:ABC transporter substrate-binding protein [Desulfobulbaceae bacterium]
MTFAFKFASAAAALLLAFGLQSAQAADIHVGVSEALSGGAAQYGNNIRNGMQLAADEINAAGGINGNKLVLVIEDDQTKKEEAINVFRKLIFQDKVLMVFGPTLSNGALAAHPIAQAAKTVAFATSNTVDGITDPGNYIFRSSVTEASVIPVTVQVAKEKLGLKKVAVLYGNNDALSKGGYDVFKKALEDQHIAVTTTETFATGDVDFKAQLTKIKGTNPDAVVLSALIAEAGPIVAQARQLGINVPFIGGNGLNNPRIFEMAPGTASDDIWVGGPWSLDNATPENSKFIANYKAHYNTNPDQFAAQAYDGMCIAAAAMKKVHFSGDIANDRAALRDALTNVQWTGATGPFKFTQIRNKAGQLAGYDAVQTPIISVTKDGKYNIVH